MFSPNSPPSGALWSSSGFPHHKAAFVFDVGTLDSFDVGTRDSSTGRRREESWVKTYSCVLWTQVI